MRAPVKGRRSATDCWRLLSLVALLQGIVQSSSGAGPAPLRRAAAIAPAITLTIPLATLDEVRRLEQRPEITEVLRSARAYAELPIFLAAYVTDDDVRSRQADAAGVADELVIQTGGYLASRGIEAARISGRGMGIDPAIGRAVVVSFGVRAPPLELGPPMIHVSSWPTRLAVLPPVPTRAALAKSFP